MSKNRSRPCVVDELELTPTFDKEPKNIHKGSPFVTGHMSLVTGRRKAAGLRLPFLV